MKRFIVEVQCRRLISETASFAEALSYIPISTIYISPNCFDQMMIPGKELYRNYMPGCVVGGDWDKQTQSFTDSIYYQSLRQRFVDGEPWEETRLYQSAINRDPGNYYHGCETVEDVHKRMAHLDSVYQSIKEDGYLSQRELQRKNKSNRKTTPPELREVRINIDRHGKPIFDDGRHRFAMAKLLDVDKIPVIIIGRHREWWEQGGRVTDVIDH